jgi:hypothetical protein
VYLVNPTASNLDLAGAKVVNQCASVFLVSTLPRALAHGAPCDVLNAAADAAVEPISVFPALKVVFDSSEPQQRRCQAIEYLARCEVTVSPDMLRRLLECEDGTVARYSLGLADSGPGEQDALSVAEGCAHVNDPLFRAELDLLKQLSSR